MTTPSLTLLSRSKGARIESVSPHDVAGVLLRSPALSEVGHGSLQSHFAIGSPRLDLRGVDPDVLRELFPDGLHQCVVRDVDHSLAELAPLLRPDHELVLDERHVGDSASRLSRAPLLVDVAYRSRERHDAVLDRNGDRKAGQVDIAVQCRHRVVLDLPVASRRRVPSYELVLHVLHAGHRARQQRGLLGFGPVRHLALDRDVAIDAGDHDPLRDDGGAVEDATTDVVDDVGVRKRAGRNGELVQDLPHAADLGGLTVHAILHGEVVDAAGQRDDPLLGTDADFGGRHERVVPEGLVDP
jgi:hypothetical protein